MSTNLDQMFRDGTQKAHEWANSTLIPAVEQHIAYEQYYFDRNILKLTTTLVTRRKVRVYTKFRSVALAVQGHFDGTYVSKLRRLPFPLLGRYVVTVNVTPVA